MGISTIGPSTYFLLDQVLAQYTEFPHGLEEIIEDLLVLVHSSLHLGWALHLTYNHTNNM